MADNQLTIEQISIVLDKALKPLSFRLERIEGKVDLLETRFDRLEDKVDKIDEVVHEMKFDLEIIKEDYIGQVDEIRLHVGMSPIIKHKTA
jgi:predicted nuclease with TOPRIM domain